MWIAIDDEVLIWRVRKQADARPQQAAIRGREIARDGLAEDLFVLAIGAPICSLRVDAFAAMVIFADLETGYIVLRKPVEHAFGRVEHEHREGARRESRAVVDLEPPEDLAFWRQQRRDGRREMGCPCAG